MMKYNFDEIIRREKTDSVKDEQRKQISGAEWEFMAGTNI
jgi:hypothetical protein